MKYAVAVAVSAFDFEFDVELSDSQNVRNAHDMIEQKVVERAAHEVAHRMLVALRIVEPTGF